MKKSSDSLWDSFSYLTIEQKKSIVELTNSYEKPIIPRVNLNLCSSKVLEEENIKETPFLFDRNVLFYAILFQYYDSMRKIESSSLEEFKLKKSLGKLKKRNSILNNASKNIHKMIDGLNNIRELQQKVGNNFDEIFKVREKSLNELSKTSKDLLLLKNFSEKLDVIESLQDPKALLYSTELKCEFLDKVDNLWDFLKDYVFLHIHSKECFQDITKYCRILDLSRQSILKSISNSMESVLNNAVNDTIENIKNQKCSMYTIDSHFRNISPAFLIDAPHTQSTSYDNLVNYISDKYIISRLGLLTGLANSSVQVLSTEHDSLVTLIHIMCCLFMRICDNEHLLYTSFFIGSEDTVS
ncbi:hypothetical protein MXB_4556 [Myxobolus squamalis]|nr:hypothetical protein MXB_4556 [Myxobolus squamalis]